MTLGASVAAISLVGAWVFAQPSAAEQAPAEGRALPVETAVLEPVDGFARERRVSGKVVPRRRSALGFERGGRLVEVLVHEGQPVEAEAPLARLDTRRLEAQQADLQAQRARAQAQLDEMRAGPRAEVLARARARVDELEEDLKLLELRQTRRAALVKDGAASQEALDEARHGLAAQHARLAQARQQLAELDAGTRVEQLRAQEAVVAQLDASLRLIEIELDDSVLRAPFAGVVGLIVADAGVVLGAGQQVLELVESGALEAWVGLPEALAGQVTPGQTLPLEVEGRTLEGTVRALLPEVEASTRTVTCVLDLTGLARADAMVRLVLDERVERRGFWLPVEALQAGERDLWSCLVVVDGRPARVERRQLEVLELETDRVLVGGDLRAGERVVISGLQRLVPGMAVAP